MLILCSISVVDRLAHVPGGSKDEVGATVHGWKLTRVGDYLTALVIVVDGKMCPVAMVETEKLSSIF